MPETPSVGPEEVQQPAEIEKFPSTLISAIEAEGSRQVIRATIFVPTHPTVFDRSRVTLPPSSSLPDHVLRETMQSIGTWKHRPDKPDVGEMLQMGAEYMLINSVPNHEVRIIGDRVDVV